MDNRWTCKLSGFGLRNLLRGEQPHDTQDDSARYTSEYGDADGGVARNKRICSQEPGEGRTAPHTQNDNTRYTTAFGGSGGVDGDGDGDGGGVCNEGMCS